MTLWNVTWYDTERKLDRHVYEVETKVLSQLVETPGVDKIVADQVSAWWINFKEEEN